MLSTSSIRLLSGTLLILALPIGCAALDGEGQLASQRLNLNTDLRLAAEAQAAAKPEAQAAAKPATYHTIEERIHMPGRLKAQDEKLRLVSHQPPILPEEVPVPPQPPINEPPVAAPPSKIPINFTSALAMAAGENPQVSIAQARIEEALAQNLAARTLWLPSLRAGVSYNQHDGALQNIVGGVNQINRAALNAGLGVNSVAAGSPGVPGVFARFHVADAIFQPRITDCTAAAREAAGEAAIHDVLLQTSLAYQQLLAAMQQKVIAEATRDNAQNLAKLTADFAAAGQGSQADADRAAAELALRKNEVVRTEEAVDVASARLAEILRLDASAPFAPQEATVAPLELVSLDVPRSELVAMGLSQRPELAESRELVCEAVERMRREAYAPLVPSVLLGVSFSKFGGGPNSAINNYDNRYDLDAVAYWEVRNFGFGEHAARREADSRLRQARLREIQMLDRVAREIAEGATQVEHRRRQISTAQDGIRSATDSYDRNLRRIRDGQGLPLEVLQSLQALDQARREYLRVVVDYNEAQFRLQRAIGWAITPPAAEVSNAKLPVPNTP